MSLIESFAYWIFGMGLALATISIIILAFSAMLPSIYHRSPHGTHITIGDALRSYKDDARRRKLVRLAERERARRDKQIWEEFDSRK